MRKRDEQGEKDGGRSRRAFMYCFFLRYLALDMQGLILADTIWLAQGWLGHQLCFVLTRPFYRTSFSLNGFGPPVAKLTCTPIANPLISSFSCYFM